MRDKAPDVLLLRRATGLRISHSDGSVCPRAPVSGHRTTTGFSTGHHRRCRTRAAATGWPRRTKFCGGHHENPVVGTTKLCGGYQGPAAASALARKPCGGSCARDPVQTETAAPATMGEPNLVGGAHLVAQTVRLPRVDIRRPRFEVLLACG